MSKSLALFAVAVAVLLAGCQFIPGQPEYRIRQGEEAVAMTFPDPGTTQFRDSRELRTTLNGDPNNLSICGRVNTKNQLGAYVGFRRYVFNKGRTLVDPATGASGEEAVDKLTACNAARETRRNDPNPFRGNGRVQIACDAYNGYIDELTLQQMFEHVYRNNCGGHLSTPAQMALLPPADWDGSPTMTRVSPATFETRY